MYNIFVLYCNINLCVNHIAFQKVASCHHECIGFAVPCQHWILVLKHFFWRKVGTLLATCNMSYQSCFRFKKYFFNCSFTICTFICVNYSLPIFLLQSRWFSYELSSIQLLPFRLVLQRCFWEVEGFFSYHKGNIYTLSIF